MTNDIMSVKMPIHKTSPLTPLLDKERGNKAQLYWGEVLWELWLINQT